MTTKIDTKAALAVLAAEGGRFQKNVWSEQLDQAAITLRAAIDAGQECGARYHDGKRLVLIPTVGMGATHVGWSDREPYEIVKVISLSTIEVRGMKAERNPAWKPDFVPGGFCGTVVNQNEQEWFITSNPEAPVTRLRLMKDGTWNSTKYGKFVIGYAHKFYDYNF